MFTLFGKRHNPSIIMMNIIIANHTTVSSGCHHHVSVRNKNHLSEKNLYQWIYLFNNTYKMQCKTMFQLIIMVIITMTTLFVIVYKQDYTMV